MTAESIGMRGKGTLTFRSEAERDETRIRAARLLVRTAKMLHREIDPSVLADAARRLPNER